MSRFNPDIQNAVRRPSLLFGLATILVVLAGLVIGFLLGRSVQKSQSWQKNFGTGFTPAIPSPSLPSTQTPFQDTNTPTRTESPTSGPTLKPTDTLTPPITFTPTVIQAETQLQPTPCKAVTNCKNNQQHTCLAPGSQAYVVRDTVLLDSSRYDATSNGKTPQIIGKLKEGDIVEITGDSNCNRNTLIWPVLVISGSLSDTQGYVLEYYNSNDLDSPLVETFSLVEGFYLYPVGP